MRWDAGESGPLTAGLFYERVRSCERAVSYRRNAVRHARIASAADGARQFVHGVAVHIDAPCRQQQVRTEHTENTAGNKRIATIEQ
jgi:hypothetical protein